MMRLADFKVELELLAVVAGLNHSTMVSPILYQVHGSSKRGRLESGTDHEDGGSEMVEVRRSPELGILNQLATDRMWWLSI